MDTPRVRYIRSRIANACDNCKARKVKCDGNVPCRYCEERGRGGSCVYSPQKKRRTPASRAPSTPKQHSHRQQRQQQQPSPSPAEPSSAGAAAAAADSQTTATTRENIRARDTDEHSRGDGAEDETDVPREARLLRDSQGKLIFIGDCAPLSFFQSVRQLVTSKVSPNAFAPETSRFSVLANSAATTGTGLPQRQHTDVGPAVNPRAVQGAMRVYLATTAGLLDMFDDAKLLEELVMWASLQNRPTDGDTVKYLVLAIGLLNENAELAQEYFEYARGKAYEDLNGDLSVSTVQAFVLIAVYMLCSCQINGAFLFFGIAVRAAYSIGVHRTEVNARFGADGRVARDRLWKSLRVVDLCLSISMGRPPATSDVDCTVAYRAQDAEGNEVLDLLNADVQILLITEVIVTEIFSRKKISLALTEGISVKLRGWSERWLQRLKGVVESGRSDADVAGACQVLASYYYSVMLVSRPFLMYEMHRRLLAEGPKPGDRGRSGKTKLADACIDAASLMVDTVVALIHRGALPNRAPVLVSWLFAASLVLGLGLMGGFGRILEKCARMSIQTLDHFALQGDAHAAQYSLIAQSLLNVALEDLDKREMRERMMRTENSSLLFGLVPAAVAAGSGDASPHGLSTSSTITSVTDAVTSGLGHDRPFHALHSVPATSSPRMLGDMDSAYLGLSESLLHTPDGGFWSGGFDEDAGSALNLFPLLDTGGGIDLAHYL